MKIEKQKQNVNHLFELIKDNPDLPIVPLVATECVHDDSYGYWLNKWGSAEIDEYYVEDGRFYLSDDFEELVDEWIDNNFQEYSDLTQEDLEDLAVEEVKKYDWIKAIVVRIEPA